MKVDYSPRPQNQLLYSWDPQYEYGSTDVFSSFKSDRTLLVTSKDYAQLLLYAFRKWFARVAAVQQHAADVLLGAAVEAVSAPLRSVTAAVVTAIACGSPRQREFATSVSVGSTP